MSLRWTALTRGGKVVAAVDLSPEAGNPATAMVDNNGHGTHMAGIIAGRETGADPALAAQHPEWFLGVAPDAGIVSVKVGDRNGDVLPGGLAAAVNWTVDNAEQYGIRVINLSVGSDEISASPFRVDPLSAAVQRAWDAGLVVVVAAGNDGADANGLTTPANDPYVIAVAGADVETTGVRAAEWTSSGDGVRNPDVAAPGAHIQSLRVPGSDADVNHPEGYVDAETFKGSGSSQGAAAVAGCGRAPSRRPARTDERSGQGTPRRFRDTAGRLRHRCRFRPDQRGGSEQAVCPGRRADLDPRRGRPTTFPPHQRLTFLSGPGRHGRVPQLVRCRAGPVPAVRAGPVRARRSGAS